jgi:hypothetical protein
MKSGGYIIIKYQQPDIDPGHLPKHLTAPRENSRGNFSLAV